MPSPPGASFAKDYQARLNTKEIYQENHMNNRTRMTHLKARSVYSFSDVDPARMQKIIGFENESRQAREEGKL
jgi:hypothetical protein